jgi:cobalt ECF transporter T component CbiQ
MAEKEDLMSEWTPQELLGRPNDRRTGVLTSIDARLLLPAAFIVIVALTAAKHWYVPAAVFTAAFFVLMWTTSSRRSFLKLMLYPLVVALFILVVQAYTYGSTVVLTAGWPIYSEGMASGWLICVRVLASVSILLLLVESKSPTELVEALAWFKIPVEIRNLMSLMLRYISTLSAEFTTMFNAQKARCGYSGELSWLQKLKNLAIIGGMLMVRSYDRSYRVVMGMMARGYTQNADLVRKAERFSDKDYLFAAFSFTVIVGIVLAGVL